MPRLAANLTLLFREVEFLDRFGAAAACGFRGVEFLFPYDHPAEAVAERARAAGVEVVLINAPAGDLAAGEAGIAGLPGRESEFESGIERAVAYCRALDCRRINVTGSATSAGWMFTPRMEVLWRSRETPAADRNAFS